jgi:membrane protein implicated in regulation of membrane protease activity
VQDFFDWLGDNSWLAWASAGLLLAVAELVSLDLVLLMLAVGAFAGALAAILGAPLAVELLAAAAVSAAMLTMVRPSMVRRLHRGTDLVSGQAALIGCKAMVTSTVDAHGGQIKLAGEVWSARAYQPDQSIDVGTQVEVFEIDGATAVVYPE